MAEPIVYSRDNPDDIELIETGYFEYRETRGAPFQALRIIHQDGCWTAILNGEVVPGSGARLTKDIPFLLHRSPFHRITQAQYHALLDAYERAPPGHPLRTPDQPVDLNRSPGLYRGLKRNEGTP